MLPKHTTFLIARILSILLVVFFLIFSFDEPIFSLGFLMHSIPTIIILIAAAVGWKYERAGGIIFLVLGIGTLFFFNIPQHPQALLITLPFLVIGSLYIAGSKKQTPNPAPTNNPPKTP
jgi:hypothetical protein